MRVTAARLEKHGEPLRVSEIDLMPPGPDEVVVDMAFCGMNPIDVRAAQGKAAQDGPLPRTLGTEGAGTVDGRAVMVRGHGIGIRRDGLWASAAVVPKAALIDVPEGVGLAEAAAMGVAGVTAWRTVTEFGRVDMSDVVLVLGASGGVGSVIVSAAKGLGARVIGHTGQQDMREFVTRQGADEVIVADAGGLAEALRSAGALDGADQPTVVFDPLGGPFTGAAIEALAPRGRLVLYGTAAGAEGTLPLKLLHSKGITLIGYAGLLESDDTMTAATAAALEARASGRLSIPIDAAVPLSEINDVFERLTRREIRGNLVLNAALP